MGLLGFLKKAGSGVNNWLDEGAMEALGPGLSTLLATPGQTPIPKAGLLAPRPLPQQAPLTAPPQQQPLATDPMADSFNDDPMTGLPLDGSPPVGAALPQPGAATQRGRAAGAPSMAPMNQPIQMTAGTPGHAWQPSAEDKKAIRGAYVSNFLNNMGNVLQGRGGTGTQEFRQDILTQLVLQHQAEQSSQQMAQKQQVLQGFSQDMQSAGTDPDMQRKALNKWAPYVGADMAKAFGDIAKDYGPKPQEIRTITNADGSTREVAFDPIKGTLTDLPGGAGAKPRTVGAGAWYRIDGNKQPQYLVHDQTTGELRTPGVNGQVIDSSRVTPFKEPTDTPVTKEAIALVDAGGDPKDPTTWTPQVLAKMKANAVKEVDPLKEAAALDRMYSTFAPPFQKALDGSYAQLTGLNQARIMINGDKTGKAVGQALGVIKTLTSLAGGQGVRITQAELNSLPAARGIKEDVEGWLNKMTNQGQLAGGQIAQINSLLDQVAQLAQQKMDTLNAGLGALAGSRSHEEIINNLGILREMYYGKPSAAATAPYGAGAAPAAPAAPPAARWTADNPFAPKAKR